MFQNAGGFGQQPGTSGGLFGQASTGLGGGGGGLFGLSSAGGSTFGGGFGQATTSSGFGALGAQPQNQPQTPVFGNPPQNQPFGGTSGGSGGLFGQTAQPGGFGGQQTSGFGAFGGGSAAPQNLTAGSGFGTFTQAAQSTPFGGQLFGGGASTSGFGGTGGAFGQSTSGFGAPSTGGFGGKLSTFGQQNQQQQQQQPQQQQTTLTQQANPLAKGFYKQIQPSQQVMTWNVQFQPKAEQSIDARGNFTQQQSFFHSIKVEPQMALLSTQMIKLMDTILMKSNGAQQQTSYEFTAAQEYQQNGSQYKFYQELQNAAAGAPVGGGFQQANPQGGFLGQTQSSGFGLKPAESSGLFGQTGTTSTFGQPATGFGQTQGLSGGGIFGNSSGSFGTKPFGQTQGLGATASTGGFFGQQQQQPQQQQPFGGGFGQAAATGGLFGQAQPQQQPYSQPFGGGGGGFGQGFLGQQQQQPAAGGLFGQQPQQQPQGGLFGQGGAQGGGLFGQAKPAQGGGLFNQQQPAAGGLFGQQQQQPQQQQPGLFGQQQTGTPGLFGAGAQQQQQPSTLFGGAQQQQQQPGAFGSLGNQQPTQGGLFGQQQQQPQASQGLFGGTGAQGGGGGLFGKPTAGTGLFGVQAQPAQTGLFGQGAGQQQQQQQPGGGLFGQQQPGAGGSGLFGTGAQNQPQGQGLFAGGTGAAASTGLFGAKLGAGGGLFGPSSGQPGLFGGQNQAQTPGQGGLFQQPSAQPSIFGAQPSASPSLFGPQSSFNYNQQSSSTLFPQTANAQQQQQQQQQQFMMNPYMSLEMRADPFAIKESFLEKESPFANIDAELQKLKEQTFRGGESEDIYRDIKLMTQVGTPYESRSTPTDLLTTPDQTRYDLEEDEYEKDRQRKNRELIQKYQSISTQDEDSERSGSKQKFNPVRGYMSGPVSQPTFGSSQRPTRFGGAQKHNDGFGVRDNDLYEPRHSHQTSEISSRDSDKDDVTQPRSESQTQNKDVLNVTVVFPSVDKIPEQKFVMPIHKTRNVQDLYDRATKYFRDNYQLPDEDIDYVLLYKNHIIDKANTLKQEGITSNCQIFVCSQSKSHNKSEENAREQGKSAAPPSTVFNPMLDQLASKEKLPTQPKAGYITTPSYMDIIRMTLRQLQNVENFSVENEHGKIEFQGITDLSEVDLFKIVTLTKGEAEVYDDSDPTTVKPPVGQKLNKPAIITLHNMDIKNQPSMEQKIAKFKDLLQKKESIFISYDLNKNLRFKVPHFTKYNFDADDGEEESEVVQQNQSNRFQQQQNQQQQQQQELIEYENLDDALLDGSVKSQDQRQYQNLGGATLSTSNFARQFSKPANDMQRDSLFTTQPIRSNTVFTGQPFATVRQTSIPSYDQPLTIEQRQNQGAPLRQQTQNTLFNDIDFATSKGGAQSSGLYHTNNILNGKQNLAGGPTLLAQKTSTGLGLNRPQSTYHQLDNQSVISEIEGYNHMQIDEQEELEHQQNRLSEQQMNMDIDQLSELSGRKRKPHLPLYGKRALAKGQEEDINLQGLRRRRVRPDGTESMADESASIKSAATSQRQGKIQSDYIQANFDQRTLKAQQVLQAISEKREKFEAFKITKNIDRPSAENTMKIFQKFKIQLPNQKLVQPPKIMPMRPVFGPNGSLLTVKQNSSKIKINQIPLDKVIKNIDDKQAYEGLTDILLKHGNFKEDELDPNLGIRFNQLNLQSLQADQQVHSAPQSFDDPYFERLLTSTKVHTLEFASNPTDQFYIYEDLSKMLIDRIQKCEQQKPQNQSISTLRQKLQEEFYVVCTMNALFGNPCIQLVQLHHHFTGLRNYEKARKVFGRRDNEELETRASKEYEDAYTFQTQKQRRNALTEVIRFICQEEFNLAQPKPNQNIYEVASHYLMNGDLKSTLVHLNRHNKFKMALLVSQAITSTSSGHNLHQTLQSQSSLYSNFSKSTLDIITLMKGELNEANAPKTTSWLRWLSYYLNIKCQPNMEFQEVLQQFDMRIYSQFEQAQLPNQGVYPLIYLLIKLYMANKQGKENLIRQHLTNFEKVQPRLSINNVQDHRLQMLMIMIFFYLQKHYRNNRGLYGDKMDGFEINGPFLARHALVYASQLLRSGDWKQALLIAQIIPKQSIKLKKQLIFSILQQYALQLTYHQGLIPNSIQVTQKFRIEKPLLNAARAFAYQYRHHYEQAFVECLGDSDDKNRNVGEAHHILSQHLAPLYFKVEYQNQALVKQSLIHQTGINYVASNSILFTEAFDKIQQAYQTLNKRNQEPAILDFTQNSALYLFVVFYISKVYQTQNSSRDPLQFSESQKVLRDIASNLGQKDQLQKDNLQRLIWEHLVEYDNKVKIANAKSYALGNIQQLRSAQSQMGCKELLKNFEPMLDLVNLYPQNPRILQMLDQINVQSVPFLVCNKA